MEASAASGGAKPPAKLQTAAAYSWRILAVLALAAVAIFILWHLRVVWIPLFLALLFATVLLPLTDWLAAHGVPRPAAVFASIIVFVVAVSLVMTLIVGSIVGEAGQISKLVGDGAGEISQVTKPKSGPLSLDRDSVRGVVADLGSGLKTAGSKVLSKAASEASTAVSVVVTAVLSLAFLIYLLSGSAGIREWMVKQGGKKHGDTINRVVNEGWKTLGGYMRGTLLVAVFVSFFIGIAAFALGLPIAGTLIAVTFFASFIPIIGAWIAGVIVTLIAFAGGGVEAGVVMVIVQVLVHGAESLFIAPKAYQETLSLNPIVILSAVTAGTALMGVIGAIIAVPLVAFFWVAFKEVRERQAAVPAATADA